MSKKIDQTSALFANNAVFIEELYQQYLNDSKSVAPDFAEFFDKFADEKLPLKPNWGNKFPSVILKSEPLEATTKQLAAPQKNILPENFTDKVILMINAYRRQGHSLVQLDPLNEEILKNKQDLGLTIEKFGLSEANLANKISASNNLPYFQGEDFLALIHYLESTYTKDIAVEFDHVDQLESQWLYSEFERISIADIDSSIQKRALKTLSEIEGLEQYLHTKFPGAKRFSIEGSDSAILSLKEMVESSGIYGIEEIIVGMAHRGRLVTLGNVLNKPYHAILSEFMGTSPFPKELNISGDVKYHMGYSSDQVIDGYNLHISLCPNPSHLEAVNPVACGKVRATQDAKGDSRRKSVAGILIHGDAAFAGQGVVAENLMMNYLAHFTTGGILHIVINNQLGFTANANENYYGRYPTNFAKIIGAPVMHINVENADAILKATRLALNYREKFGKDIVIDVIGYRKYGHNEGDEPMYTQGVMYSLIKNKETPGKVYAEYLAKRNIISAEHFAGLKESFKAYLDAEYTKAKDYKPTANFLQGRWKGYTIYQNSKRHTVETGIDQESLRKLGLKLCEIPQDFDLNPKLVKLIDNKKEALTTGKSFDWSLGEQLAFASLLSENIPIRLTGQDVARGTFSHRHSVLFSQTHQDKKYIPLNNISSNQAKFAVANSNLTEYGTLGFEYGYSQVDPKNLVIWEAQFGDFANGAQIIFDQFISSAESKWLKMSGLVMLLPHGFEGQGPEHSSARLERFLQLCAEYNMQVANPTTPASLFHLLRRQMHRDFRVPLIVMSPKSLLRHKLAVSDLDDFVKNTMFAPIIKEVNKEIVPDKVSKVIVCSGKIYYDLFEKREELKIKNIAIIRLEQLYPLEVNELNNALKPYKNLQDVVWCQEEPQNMGAWSFIHSYIDASLEFIGYKFKVKYIGRKTSASPAVGSLYEHTAQQQKLITQALNGE